MFKIGLNIRSFGWIVFSLHKFDPEDNFLFHGMQL